MDKEGGGVRFANSGTLTFKCASSSLPIVHASIVTPPSTTRYFSSTGRTNISKVQEELLLWHSILRHYDVHNT